jgi:hypothetical protein
MTWSYDLILEAGFLAAVESAGFGATGVLGVCAAKEKTDAKKNKTGRIPFFIMII